MRCKKVSRRTLPVNDGGRRSLSTMVVNGRVVEKHMMCKMLWDLEAIKKEQDDGADGAGFKHWEKQGLAALESHCGTHLASRSPSTVPSSRTR